MAWVHPAASVLLSTSRPALCWCPSPSRGLWPCGHGVTPEQGTPWRRFPLPQMAGSGAVPWHTAKRVDAIGVRTWERWVVEPRNSHPRRGTWPWAFSSVGAAVLPSRHVGVTLCYLGDLVCGHPIACANGESHVATSGSKLGRVYRWCPGPCDQCVGCRCRGRFGATLVCGVAAAGAAHCGGQCVVDRP